jgi:hypothetical protein
VKNGAQLLDRLLKDIVTESNSFDIEKFIILLRVRQTFFRGWEHRRVRDFISWRWGGSGE